MRKYDNNIEPNHYKANLLYGFLLDKTNKNRK